MNIIIPKDTNVPYVIIDMLSFTENGEVEDIVLHGSHILQNNNIQDFYDKYLFVIPKEELIPQNLKEKGITPTYKNLSIILNKYKNNLSALPYFKEMINLADNLPNLPANKQDPSVYLLKTRAKLLSRSSLKSIIPIEKGKKTFTFIKPLWNHSYQLFGAVISEIPDGIKELEFEENPKHIRKDQKVLDVRSLGACPEGLLREVLPEDEIEDIIQFNSYKNKSIKEICKKLGTQKQKSTSVYKTNTDEFKQRTNVKQTKEYEDEGFER